ncbi:DUF3168 domain-containing protein [Rhodovulum sp. YNF3179]|mgnify:CR=1 FL=1|uniref:DUF3168 domain-containing protein n=1 Tax=Rhodovulum sp. YNF3179 TaxID=3425127 RepID=UPI003D3533EE
MSYAQSAALQAAVYETLATDPALNALLGDAIFDTAPADTLPPLYVRLGPEQVRDSSDASGPGAVHDFTVLVGGRTGGFHAAKSVAAAVCEALHDTPLALARGRLVSLRFTRARARRGAGAGENLIELRFRARLEDA